jgi:hypothetical protein
MASYFLASALRLTGWKNLHGSLEIKSPLVQVPAAEEIPLSSIEAGLALEEESLSEIATEGGVVVLEPEALAGTSAAWE